MTSIRFILLFLVLAVTGWSQAWQTVRSFRGTGVPAANMCNTGADLGIIYTDRNPSGLTYVCRLNGAGAFTWYVAAPAGGAQPLNANLTTLSATGNVPTAAALLVNPAACIANRWVMDIAADGTLTCTQPASTDLSDSGAIVRGASALTGSNALLKDAAAGQAGVSNTTSASLPFDVKAYGATGNQRTVTDAAITAVSPTLTSATAAFTSADTGKTVTVHAGSAGILSATYTSGGTIVGATGTTCLFNTFNGGGTGATAVVKLTSANTIAGGTALTITVTGSDFTSAPTSATLTSGTATCSGTAVVSSIRFYAVVVATATYVNPTTITLSANAVNTVTGATMHIGTDDSTAILAAVQAAYNAGGGTVHFPVGKYLMLSQLAIPNNSASPVPKQPPISITGAGPAWDGTLYGIIDPPGSSILDLRYAGTVAKIDTRGSGSLTISGLTIANLGYDTLPFLQTTNTTVFLRDNTWLGPLPGRAASLTDAIVLGGVDTMPFSGAATSGFQGFGTVIERNLFSRIRRGIYGRTYCNDTMATNNTWSSSSGGLTAIEIDGTAAFASQNGWGNFLVEATNYTYGITLRKSVTNTFYAIQFIDPGAPWVAGVRLVGISTANSCVGCGGITVADDTGGNTFPYFQGGKWYGSQDVVGIFNQGNGNAFFNGGLAAAMSTTLIPPAALLPVYAKGTAAAPASTGSTPTGTAAFLGSNNATLYFGTYSASPFALWMQTSTAGSLSQYYPLALNPRAGGVSIGLGDYEPGSGNLAVVGTVSAAPGGTVPACAKYTVPYTNAAFFTAATGVDVTLFALPARGKLIGVNIKHSVAFAGTAVSSTTVSVGDGASTYDQYASAYDIFQAVGDTVFQDSSQFKSTTMAASNVKARFTANTNFGTGAATVLTAGSVDVAACWVVLP